MDKELSLLRNKDSDMSVRLLYKDELSLCLSPPSFWVPHLINTSAWIEHAPFAFWLVKAISPNTIVELGAHQGYSYFVFCQAIQQLALSTRCYAIDTWKGDEHSGFYGEEVFQNFNAYNNQQYSGFSRLIRSTFDDALDYFLDGSIDILHIDGRHFYEDVKYDFETWLPKLSNRGIVLFHDTNVKEKNFGVFKFWDELCQLYPHFEFIHGNGLGVLGIGKSISPELHALFDAAHHADLTAHVRAMYNRLGAALTDRYHTMQIPKLEQTITNMLSISEENKQQKIEINVLKNQLEQQLQESQHLQQLHESQRLQQLQESQRLQQLQESQRLQQIQESQQLQEVQRSQYIQEMQYLQNQLTEIQATSKEKDAAIKYLNRILMKIYSSKFWRLSWPLRKLGQIFSRS